MDSEHRHELKTNELADLLTHFPQFLKRNANFLIGISLIIIGLISWWVLPKMKQEKEIAEETRVSQSIQMLGQDIRLAVQTSQANPEQADQALNTILANAEALLEISADTENPDLLALACIKAAQAIRTELHLRTDFVSAETVSAQIQKAEEAYAKAAQTASLPNMQAMAQIGIGLCAEERGQIEQARDIYNEIVGNETFESTVFPKMAQQRLDMIEENAESFTFAQVPEAEQVAPAQIDTDMNILQPQPADVPALEDTLGQSDAEQLGAADTETTGADGEE